MQDATTPRSRVEGRKPKHVDGTSAHMGEGKGSVLEGITSLFQGSTIVSDYDAMMQSIMAVDHRSAGEQRLMLHPLTEESLHSHLHR